MALRIQTDGYQQEHVRYTSQDADSQVTFTLKAYGIDHIGWLTSRTNTPTQKQPCKQYMLQCF